MARRKRRLPKGAKQYARRKAYRPPRKRVLIVCEGEKTEPRYLRSLAGHLGLTTVEVEVCHQSGSAPINVVNFGVKRLEGDPDLDILFFVFDRDSHTTYKKALQKVQEFNNLRRNKHITLKAITSVPCFEFWFLLHFELCARPFNASRGKSPCEVLISRLKTKPEFKNYGKGGGNHFSVLKDRLEIAKRNSLQVLKQVRSSGASNPSTLMHELVEELEKIAAT